MKSDGGKALFTALQKPVRNCLQGIDALEFDRSKAAVEEAQAILKQQHDGGASYDEDTLNDLAILGFFARFLSEYAAFWERVTKREYEPSWMALQDTLDSIRLLKRMSMIDVARFEKQLGQLEQVYPYKIFASVGCIAERIECSICGKDIDSFECLHRRGELYMGKMAHGIVRNMKKFDHVALTENPEDKRCVMQVQGTPYQFPAIDWLAENLTARKFTVSDISHVEMSERRKRNENIIRQGRNDPCQCGSGKKFKHCCSAKQYSTYPHGEFILLRKPPRVTQSV
jgi:hypothetical protein